MKLSWSLVGRIGLPRAVAISAGALLSLPILVDLALSPRTRSFDFLAPDAFYYFTVARHISRLGAISFDQEHATNGFHPLWQALLAACHWWLDRLSIDESQLLLLSLVLGAVLSGLGVYLLGRAAALESGKLSVLFVGVPLGLLSLVFLPWMDRWTSMWGAVNGMETCLVLLFFGMTAGLYVRQSSALRDSFFLGAALSLLTLSRLDHGIFAALLIASLWLRKRSLRQAALVSSLWLSSLAVYLLVNRLYSGMWLPVSGTIKSTFPKITDDNIGLLRQFSAGAHVIDSLVGRGIVLFAPMAVAAAFLPYALCIHFWKKGLSRYQAFLAVTALGVIALGLYDFLYVPTFNMGRWYFPVSTLFASLFALDAVGHIPWPTLGTPAPAILLGVLAASVLALDIHYRVPPGIGGRSSHFYYEEAPKVAAYYGGHVPPLVEYDDGIVAFATGAKALSGWGLAIDRDAVESAKSIAKQSLPHGLMDLALERGYERCATLFYAGVPLAKDSSDKTIRQAYRFLLSRSSRGYRFSVEYLSDDQRFSIVKAEPRK